jgi:catechol 2,3-dioxygenase-like lactoylglutathione lyase family enzyme
MKIRRVVPDLHGDPAASRAFYEDVIGLELGMDLGWIATFRSPSNETAQLSVLSSDATAPVAPDVSIEVEDVDAVHARAVEQELRDRPSPLGRAVGSAPLLRPRSQRRRDQRHAAPLTCR